MSAARPWLRSLRRRAAAPGLGGDDHAALPRRHLLVGVEGEGGEVAAAADRAALRVDRAERLAGVLQQAEAAGGGDRLELGHRRRVAEDVDRQDPDGALADRRRSRRGVEVERLRVDVAEDRPHPLVEQAVGGGDEAEAGWSGPRSPALQPSARTPRCSAAVPLETATASSTPSQAAKSRSKRSPIGPSESCPERRTSSTSSSSRAPISGRASGIGSSSGLTGRRTPASRPGPPRRPR